MIVEKGLRWPVDMHRFYGIKHLRKDYKSPAIGMDYGPLVHTRDWASPIWLPRASERGYHVYLRRDVPLVGGYSNDDLFYLAECVVPCALVDSMVRHELKVACTSIRLLEPLETGYIITLGYRGDDVLGGDCEERNLLNTLAKEANQ